ncbi:MAG: hypothetical protein JJE51_11890 [Thermoanaerobaculia bacterium]|nr:hypothetical protein [Thermoanaerobaculia bacterium]
MMLFVLAGVLLIAPSALAQHQHPAGTPSKKMSTAKMPPMDCESMMQEMHASAKVMDDRLKLLIDEMNNAGGSAKVDRMAAVINELVTQRTAMREGMMTMMMGHMHGPMAGCPMMKGKHDPDSDPIPLQKP